MSDRGKFKRYRIGEAAKKLGVKTSVLRFWEGEFEQLEPVRTASGQRLYTEKHLDLLRRIKSLLYVEGLTLEGARRRLEEADREREAAALVPAAKKLPLFAGTSPRDTTLLREVAGELRSILALLAPPGQG
ncbi:MAG: MerR family transcriptional regulator [Desulfovibrio sp.]